MNEILIGFTILVVILVYMIATHKITAAKIDAGFASLKDQLHLTHAAALSVMATPASSSAAPADLVKTVTDAIAAAAADTRGKPFILESPNPFVAWKAQGKDLLWIQTFGLQRALTAAEWDQAVAAGYTKDSGPQPGAAENEVARDFSAPVLDYEYVRSRDMTFTGPVAKTVTKCPDMIKVKVGARSGAVLKTPYWVTVNGVRSPAQDNAQAGYAVDVSGPSVVVSIDQQPDSVIDLWIA